jgi:hypothetical protein
VAKRERTVQPELQRFVAKRMGAKTYEVDASHVPMLSRPALVIDVIRTAAQEAQGPKRTSALSGGEEHLMEVLSETQSHKEAADPRLPLFFTPSAASQPRD